MNGEKKTDKIKTSSAFKQHERERKSGGIRLIEA